MAVTITQKSTGKTVTSGKAKEEKRKEESIVSSSGKVTITPIANKPATVEPTDFGLAENTTRKANLRDLTLGSFKRGYLNSRLGEETFEGMMGQKNDVEELEKKLAADEYNFEAKSRLGQGVSGVAEQLGQQFRQMINPETLALMGTAAGMASIAGKAGPQALLPEEFITVPAAVIAAGKIGGAKANLEIEAGHAYKEMLDNGISAPTAKAVALAVGTGNAALEFVQLDELAKSFKVLNKTGASDTLMQTIANELKRRGLDVAKETAQEVAQESVTIGGVQAASKIDKGEKAYTKEEIKSRLGETAISSGLTFGLMNVPGGIYNVSSQRAASKRATAQDITKTLIDAGASEADAEKLAPAMTALLNGEEISGNQAAAIATNEAAIKELQAQTGETINTDAPLGEVKKAVRELAARQSAQASESVTEDTPKAETAQAASESETGNIITRMGKMMGKAGETVMNGMYAEGQDATQYAESMVRAYNAGLNGEENAGNLQGITSIQAKAAYDAGKIDADRNAEIADTSALSYNKTENKTEALYDGEEVHLRDSGEWTGSANPGGQVSAVAESARRIESGQTEVRSADKGTAALSYGEKVSTGSLGIGRGANNDGIRIVTGGDTEATAKARALAKERGLRLVLFSGDNLHIRQDDGSYASVRGYISGDRVFVRVDHPLYTSDQIMRHEAGHDMIAKGEINLEDVRNRIAENYDVEEAAQLYADAYAGTGMTADEIWEEVICDSLGDMNVFSETMVEEKAQEYLTETRKAAEEVRKDGDSRSPPADSKMSRDYWHSDLTKSQMEKLVQWVKHDIKTSENSITDGANWTFHTFDGLPVFAIYSTAVESNPTILYEVKGSQAKFEHQMVNDWFGGKNNGSYGTAGSFAAKIAGYGGKQSGTPVYRSGIAHAGNANANGTIYGGKRNRKPRRALLSCLENLLSERSENDVNGKASRELAIEDRINESMTMPQAKQMVQRAFVLGNIKEWFDGEYKNGDEWLRGEGADSVAMIIDNEYSLQAAYLDKIQGILDGDFYTEDVLEAYLAGTLTGKIAKKSTEKIDLANSVVVADKRFYAPKKIENAKSLYETANSRMTKANEAEVSQARAKILLYAHNKGAAETLGMTEAELNKKLRSWSNYSAKARDISLRINSNVQASNRWTGIENMSYLSRAQVTPEEVARMVKSVEGTGDLYQNNYIGRTMMALDTHIDWSWLTIKFDTYAGVNEKSSSKCNGYYLDSQKLIHVKKDAPNTVAHEMGHALDYQWARELGLRGALTEAYRNTERVSGDARIWFDHFMEFKDSLVEASDIRSAYSGNVKETFARFVDKFVAWTEQLATGRSVTYDAGYYNDKFTGNQFVQFARLLQEKAALDANGQTQNKIDKEGDYSRELESIEKMREEYRKMLEEYGAIEPGENHARDVQVPRKTEKNKNVSKTVRTIMEAEATPDEMLPNIEEMVAKGEFSYETYGDKEAISNAESKIKHTGWASALTEWTKSVESGEVSKDNTAMGWALYNNAANSGDTQTALTILDNMVRHQRSAAQALQATRILKKLSPETQLYQVAQSVSRLQEELNTKYGKEGSPKLKVDEEMAKRFMTARTQEARDEVLRDIYRDIGRQMPSTFVDKWNAWRYLAMLGNARTHVRNIVGNAGFAPIVATKNLTATAIESVVHRLSGGKLERSKSAVGGMAITNVFNKEKPLIFGNKNDRELLKAAWEDYAKVSESSMDSKYNDMANANKYIEEGKRVFKFEPLEAARRGNTKALAAEDTWFAQPYYAEAMASYCKAHGITADQIARGVKVVDVARNYAIKEARKATYQDTNAFSQMVSSWGRGRNANKTNAQKAFGLVMEGILPFRKTPANILVRGIEYSPIGLMNGIKQAVVDVKNGTKTGAEAIDTISAGLTGTGLLGLGVMLAAQGLIRGHGDDEEEKNKFMELMGHQAYALELPSGKSITLDWLAPECLPFFVGVNLWEQTGKENEKVTLSTILNSVSTVTEPLLEMSCLQSLNDVFDSVGYAASEGLEGLPAAIASAATSYLTSALPTLLGQAERSSEDVRMTTYTEKNAFLTNDMQYTLGKASARIPGWDYQQIPYIDAWGRKESSGAVGERAFNNFLNPAYTSDINESAMEKELLRLYETTGETKVFPDRAAKYFNVDKVRIDLTADQYVKYATAKGQTAQKLMTDLTKSSAYKAMSNADKVDAVSKVYEYANAVAKTKVSDYELDGWAKKAYDVNKKTGLKIDQYVLLYLAEGDIGSLPDKKTGDTIDNSHSLLVMEEIYKVKGLTDEQRQALFEAFGVGETVRHYNKALVAEKLAKMRNQ